MPPRFVFCFEMHGMVVGATVVVIAADEAAARLALSQTLIDEYPHLYAMNSEADITLKRTLSFNTQTVYISDDGDM